MKFASYLAAHAAATGPKEALVCGDRRVSFGELHAATDRLAQSLRGLGVAIGDRIAIYVPNGVEFVAAFIAVVKAGAIAVPVNLRLSVPEIAHILADCSPRAAFIAGETRAAFDRAAGGTGALRIVSDAPPAGAEHSMAALTGAGASHTPEVPHGFDDCMICYTSGTTGKAKGAILTQANYVVLNGFLNALLWGLSADDRQLVTVPLAHRTGFARVANMILHGCTLVILPRFDAPEAARLVERERVTVLGMVPTVARMLIDEVEAAPRRFATVHTILVTGEAFPLQVKQRLQRALPRVRMQSFFAMTEVGGITNLGPEEQFTHPDSVGRLIPGIELKLVDNEGIEVAPGEAGEMWVRTGEPGRFLTMRGYFGRPKETAQTIRNGWVATGDMVRRDSEGYLYVVDRKKDMVLSGGYNIYSREVELAILELDSVRDAAVVGVPDPVFGEAVAAYVELEPGARLTADQIVAHCRERIASYKKPKYVRMVEQLPRNSLGKVIKYRLREEFAPREQV